MTHLARAKKIDLLGIASEMGIKVTDEATKLVIIDLIVKHENYDEDLIKNLLVGITNEREEEELKALETQAKEREYELKKLELAAKNKIEEGVNFTKNPDVLKLISKFDGQGDISIFLNLFERQIKRLGVEKKDFTTYLLGLLPLEIVNLISREDEEKLDDYEHIKQTLLKRFKLTPEQFRQKFFTHKKENSSSWKDYAFELNNYFEEWICGLGTVSFEDLKSLIIIDQIRKRLPVEIKEHFVDELPKFTNMEDFTNKLDDYEAARNNVRKNSESKIINRDDRKKFTPTEKNNFQRNISPYGKEKNNSYSKNYPAPFKMRCFYCNEFSNHKSAQCPRRKGDVMNQDKNNIVKTVNTANENSSHSNKIFKTVKIKGQNINSLVDSGSDCTMINSKLHKDLGCPNLNDSKITLSGIDGNGVSPSGFFNTDVLIDNFKVNCDVYVLDRMNFDMILGNNCLNKINFEMSANGLRVTGKRNSEVNLSVNLVTIAPFNIPASDTPCSNVNNVRNSSNVDSVSAQSSLDDSRKVEYVYLAETVDSVKINEIDLSHLNNSAIKEEVNNLVKNYRPEKTKKVDLKVNIVLSDDIPVAQRPRRLAFTEQSFVDTQIQEWLDEGIIRESCSSYSAPIVLAKKKNGSMRLCIDYRQINKKIIKDNYPLPLIDSVLDDIGQNQVFSTLDLKNGFFHVEVDEKSKKFTSFVTNSGQYEFNYMPFGLSLAPQNFQRYIYACLRELVRDKTILIYMDDIIVLAQSEEEALVKLKRVFQVASEYGLEFNFAKCQFLKRKIEFLGYIVENGTISPSDTHILAVKKFPEPQNKKQLQSYLGLTGYFRKYIPGYAKIAKPLSDILKAEVEFNFGPTQKDAFETLKNKLINKPVLHIFRRGAETEIHTDASSLGFGSVMLQKNDKGYLHPVYYMSKKTTPAQSKYSSYELEALAVIEALKKFRTYLLGTRFKIITDCSAFQKTLEKKDLVPKVARWALFLQEFDYQILHRSGSQMRHVDALSRNTVLVVTRSQDEVTARLAKAQREDDYIQTIKTLIEKNESKDYTLKNNIIYKYENGKDLIIVPENMQKEIIRDVHNKGHYAVAKTEEIIKQNFFIPNLRKTIESVIGNCIECILCNRKRGKGEGFLNPIPKQSFPLHTYHIDHLGPLPSTNKNYNFIFSVVDSFTKFAWFYPVKTTSAKEVISKLNLQQSTFGNPAQIISDHGSAFTSTEFKNYVEEQNIRHILSTTGIPRGNGQVERLQGILIPILTKLSIEDPTKWYKHVPTVQKIMNSTYSSSTKYTPFELLTGVKLRNNNDIELKKILDEELENSFMSDRDNERSEAKINILKIQETNRKNYNKKRKRANVYKMGDLVAIQKTQFGVGTKFKPKFLGPYQIKKVKNYDRYDVEKIGFHDGPKITSTAADHMKPWSSLL